MFWNQSAAQWIPLKHRSPAFDLIPLLSSLVARVLPVTSEHECRPCGGKRPHNGSHCLGCGSPIEICRPSKNRNRWRSSCPSCASDGPHQTLEAGRYRCQKCNAIFEQPDFGFVDDRPDINVEKLEKLEADSRKRGAYNR
jgi:hypothetical protein